MKENVLWFEISVDDLLLLQVPDSFAQMANELSRLLLVELPSLLHVLVQLPVKGWFQNQVHVFVVREYTP